MARVILLRVFISLVELMNFRDVQCAKRRDVVVSGTTIGPDFIRMTAKKSTECPEDHPFTINDFESCCAHKERDQTTCPLGATGHIHEKDPVECCEGSNYVTCTDPPCKSHDKAFEIEGNWGEWGEFQQCADCSSGVNVRRYRLCLPLTPRTVCAEGVGMEEVHHCLGDEACCTPSNLCSAGYGDCQSHSDCEAGLRCGENNCVGESFDADDDCCSESTAGSWGEWGEYTYCPGCSVGRNVIRHRECLPINPLTVCETGENFEESYQCLGDEGCCTPSNLCDIGYGDCQSHSDCVSGLRCGSNNCVGDGFDSQDDCCAQPITGSWGGWGSWTRCNDCSPGMNDKRLRTCEPSGDPLTICPTGSSMEEAFYCFGGDPCCHPGNLCGEGHGDCDYDIDCESGLVCGTDNCSGEGFETPQNSGNPDDCCYRP